MSRPRNMVRWLLLIDRIDAGELSLANALSWPDLSLRDRTDLTMWVEYERRRRQWLRLDTRSVVRRSFRLLRSFLSPEQRRQLRNSRSFRIDTPGGRHFRVWLIQHAHIEEVGQHGQRWLAHWSFCIHPPLQDDGLTPVPPADVALSALLMLMADEEWFLKEANPSPSPFMRRRVVEMVRSGAIELEPGVREALGIAA